MKTRIHKVLHAWFAALVIVLLSPVATAQSFTVDTSGTALSGLWDNASESGWGTAVIHQYATMFVTMYSYDGSGNPVWYVASSCAVAANRCTGALYRVTGGSAPTVTWNGANRVVTQVGTMTMTFADVNTASMSFTINGANGSKSVRRSVFASPPVNTPGYVSQGGRTWMPMTGTLYTYAQAVALCAGTINGQTGWRIPTQAELASLLESGALVGQGWTSLLNTEFAWTSTAPATGVRTVLSWISTNGLNIAAMSFRTETFATLATCVRP